MAQAQYSRAYLHLKAMSLEAKQMAVIFGDFIDPLPECDHEFLRLGFSPSSLPIKQRWRNNGLSADFVANYLSTFFPISNQDSNARRRQAEVKGSVSYIANELLENAMKYNYEPAQYPIKFGLDMFDGEQVTIVLHVTNSINPETLEKFQGFIEDFINRDPDEFYGMQLEKIAGDATNQTTGLGLITMKNDYGAQLGWKFETIVQSSPVTTVTTMAQVKV